MIDEKRIKYFVEGAKEAFKEVDDPTFTFPINILSAYELATSIEELLKEKEAVEPIVHPETKYHHEYKECGACGAFLTRGARFCSKCGRQVNRE